MKILYYPGEGSSGISGAEEENVTITKAEHEKLVKESGEFTKLKEASAEFENKIKELEGSIQNLTEQKAETENKFTLLESEVKKEYFGQLPDEHKKIAELIPTIEGLREYVKLNAAKPPAGSDSARPGAGTGDNFTGKWDELTYNEKEELRKRRPELWKKLYREKFGFND